MLFQPLTKRCVPTWLTGMIILVRTVVPECRRVKPQTFVVASLPCVTADRLSINMNCKRHALLYGSNVVCSNTLHGEMDTFICNLLLEYSLSPDHQRNLKVNQSGEADAQNSVYRSTVLTRSSFVWCSSKL